MQQVSDPGHEAGASLWRFSLALYVRPGVAAALISLQDRAGLNVNLILFAAWLGATRGERLDALGLAAARAAIDPLHTTVVVPLRRLRRQIKTVDDTALRLLRRRVLAVELAAERGVQARLAASLAASMLPVASMHERLAAVAVNLALCLDGEAASPEAAVLREAVAALTRR